MYSKSDIKDVYFLGPLQESMLFHYKMSGSDPVYFEQFHFTLEGPLDLNLFRETVQTLVAQHDILRTVFVHQNVKRPVQVVLKRRNQEVNFQDLRGSGSDEQQRLLASFKQEDRANGFDITRDTPMRLTVFQTSDNRFEVVWSFHHIILDGWSVGLLLKQFRRIYGRLKRNKPLPAMRTDPFNGYIKWLAKQDKEKAVSYWLDYLDDYTTKSGLPHTTVAAGPDKAFRLEYLDFAVSKETTDRLKRVAKRNEVSLNTIFNVIWGLILQKYNGTSDVVFAAVVSGRPSELEGIEHIVGMFINSIPVRIKRESGETFAQLLHQVRRQYRESLGHEFVALSEIQSKTSLKRDLIDHVVVFENYPIDAAQTHDPVTGLAMRGIDVFEQINYDLNLVVIPGDELQARVAYNGEVYDRAYMERMARHIQRLAELAAQEADFSLEQFPLLDDEEFEAYDARCNGTAQEPSPYATLHQQFEAQAARTPERLAVVANGQSLTYEQLNRRANGLAKVLRDKGIGRGQIVAIAADPSPDMMAGLLGALKAGAAYLPIDPEFAHSRIEHMVRDSGAALILTHAAHADRLSAFGELLLLEEHAAGEQAHENLEPVNDADDPVYIIYTSGTTGNPKGVVVTHRNLLNYVNWFHRYTGVGENDRAALTSSFAFDLGYSALFTSITSGAALHLVSKDTYTMPSRMLEYVGAHGLTYMKMTPTLYTTLVNQPEFDAQSFAPLRFIVLGGESINVKDVEKTIATCPHVRVMNHYGPTETTIGCIAQWLDPQEIDSFAQRPTIGRPIDNMKVYLMDRDGHPLPPGLTGEICIAGIGVSKQYLGREDLSQQKFEERNLGMRVERLYRTGDLGRQLPDGRIEFLGRIDNQVKIRGYRVEPGEVKYALLKHDAIVDAHVAVKQNAQGEHALHAYLVSRVALTNSELKGFLLESLPDYMIPSSFIYMDDLPRNRNGKVDAAALPEPSHDRSSDREYEAPGTKIEHLLAEMWKELLGVDMVGVHDDFFDLGGHSLKAMMLVSKIVQELKTEITLKQLFAKPTVRGLAQLIEVGRKSTSHEVRPVPVQEHYRTSSAQKRMYVVSQLGEGTTNYNMPTLLRVEGNLNRDRLIAAFNGLIARHEALRTSFHMVDGEVVQRVHDQAPFAIRDVQTDSEHVAQTIEQCIRPFALDQAPLMRAHLMNVEDGGTLLLIDVHHLISDGISSGIILRELAALYGQGKLADVSVQYKEFAEWQQQWIESDDCKRQETFWLDSLQGDLPRLNLLTDFERPTVQSFQGDSVDFAIDTDLTEQLHRIGRETGTTLYMVLLAAYNILLSKYSSQEDLIVGTISAGRVSPAFQQTLGLFVNTLPLRSYPAGGKTVRDYLREVREMALDAFDHQDYPLDMLLDRLNLQRDASRNPLFDTVFVMENMEIPEFIMPEVRMVAEPFDYDIAKFDLTVFAEESDGAVRFRWEYCTDLYRNETMGRMVTHFIQILNELASKLDQPIAALELATDEEKQQILERFNPPPTAYPKNQTISQLFEQQVRRNPNRIALVQGDVKVTYRDLNRLANRHAAWLMERGVGDGVPVTLLTTPSVESVAAMLAVLKAGGTYVPIDAASTNERIHQIVEDSGANVLMAFEQSIQRVPEQTMALFKQEDIRVLPTVTDIPAEGYEENPAGAASSESTAYIIYTSGSTGKPKGNLTPHYSIVRVVKDTNYIDIRDEDVMLSFSNFAFDGSTFDIYGALLNGASLVLIDKDTMTDIKALSATIRREKVTLFFLTTALFNMIVELDIDCLEQVRLILFGGERASEKHIRKAIDTLGKGRLLHVYGPTETTVFATYCPLDEIRDHVIPIGRAIANTQVLVLSPNNLIQPVGVLGEICIAGDGVAKGYLNRPDLTAEKFVEHPYAPGTKMYRSGDLGRWLPDGNIEFFGRMDNQVKIRGFRIELGEIETHLLGIPGIKEGTVAVRDNRNGFKTLCAYYVQEHPVSIQELRETLSRQLPEYMVPTFFIPMERLPLTQNGKVDAKALPEPEWSLLAEGNYVAPETEIEQQLAELWSEILGIDQVGLHDNFFDLGGQSLRAMNLLYRIRETFQVNVPLKALFAQPQLRDFAQCVETAMPTAERTIERAARRAYYPTSSAQKRIYAATMVDPEQTHYNIPYVTRMKGPLDAGKLETALNTLVETHEALRTTFDVIDGEIVQKIAERMTIQLEMEEMGDVSTASVEGQIHAAVDRFIQPFDLINGPLFRCRLLRMDADDHVLMLDMHHSIADGQSIGIIQRELADLYEGASVTEDRVQYKDFAVWEESLVQSDAMQDHETYWLSEFRNGPSKLNLPTDYPRPPRQSFEGDAIWGELDAATAESVRAFASATGVTLYTVLLSAFNILMAKYSGQEELVVGTVTSGRVSSDLQHTVGMFINTLAIHGTPAEDKTPRAFVHEMSDKLLDAFEHQNYPLEKLVSALGLERDASRHPLFDVMFMLESENASGFALGGVACETVEPDKQAAKSDVALLAVESAEGITLHWTYANRLFREETLQRMHNHFVQILRNMITGADEAIAEIEWVTPEERERLLNGPQTTESAPVPNVTLLDLFDKQADKTPHLPALALNEEKLTYRQLQIKSQQIARLLADRGVRSEDRIALFLDRSFEMIAAILACWRVGAAYVPVDPEYPVDRIDFMIEDSQSALVLSNVPNAVWKLRGDREVLFLSKAEADETILQDAPASNESFAAPAPEQLAYIIYTSGTTDKPKGVAVEHRSIANTIQWRRDEYGLHEQDAVLQLFSYSFDGFLTSLFTPLVSGSVTVLVPDQQSKDPFALLHLIRTHRVTHFISVPGLYQALLECAEADDLASLTSVTLAGEKLSAHVVQLSHAKAPNTEVVNEYGPTENSVATTVCRNVQPAKIIPIGRPVANTKAAILSPAGKVVPIGVEGELCVSGPGLARGYFNRPELTAEKFIEHPYFPGTRMYRTGDAAKWLPDGTIEYVGRIDRQVKVRGFRIEPGEIEQQLLHMEGVSDVVVTDREDPKYGTYLCAYLVANVALDVSHVRQYLGDKLPDYMIPTSVVTLDFIPRTSTGKTDHKALPEPVRALEKSVGEQAAPTTETEARLVKLWQDILGIEALSVEDSFFRIGGDSLKAIRLVAEMHKQYEWKVSLSDIFAAQTLRELAASIETRDSSAYSTIEAADKRETYPASSEQTRLYLLQKFNGDSTVYNVPILLEIRGPLQIERVEEACRELIQRHEPLRTSFELNRAKIWQTIHDDVPFELSVVEVQEEQVNEAVNQSIRPFPLDRKSFFRATLFRLGEERHILLMDSHHMIVDGNSATILVHDWMALYEGRRPAREQNLQYKDYAVWQQEGPGAASIRAQEDYWLNLYQQPLPSPGLPTDFNRDPHAEPAGDTLHVDFDPRLNEDVMRLMHDKESTPFMFLLACYNVLLHKRSGSEDMAVGCAVTGRNRAEMQGMVGMFVKTLALRARVTSELTFSALWEDVKQHALAAMENQEYPFEMLVDKLKIPRQQGRNPLFDTLFEWQAESDGSVNGSTGLDFRWMEPDIKQAAKFDLTLIASQSANGFRFSFNYNSTLFRRTTIETIADQLLQIVRAVTQNPDTPVADILPELNQPKPAAKPGGTDKTFLFKL